MTTPEKRLRSYVDAADQGSTPVTAAEAIARAGRDEGAARISGPEGGESATSPADAMPSTFGTGSSSSGRRRGRLVALAAAALVVLCGTWLIAGGPEPDTRVASGSGEPGSGTGSRAASRLSSIYGVPTQLPAGFEKVTGGCANVDGPGPRVMVLAYRSDDRYSTRDYQETALLRIFVVEGARMSEVLKGADEGSVRPRKVRDTEGRQYRVTTAQPNPVAWPALVWEEGPVTVQIVGEGLDDAALGLVAEGLSARSEAEFKALVGRSRSCGDYVPPPATDAPPRPTPTSLPAVVTSVRRG